MKQSSQAHTLTVIELDIVNKTFYQLAFYDRRLSRQSISTTLYVVCSVSNSGALAPKWRLKYSGAGRKNEDLVISKHIF